jgi:hypothetical protein
VVQAVPAAVGNCASAKKIPSLQADMASGSDTCIGDRFTLVVSHAEDKRYALLYAANGGSWKFCSAGTFRRRQIDGSWSGSEVRRRSGSPGPDRRPPAQGRPDLRSS